jgi:general transcription factor 3C polypeptide 5 (transcription factor C subunit 1)
MPDLQYTAAYDQTMIGLRDNIMPMRRRFHVFSDLNLADAIVDSQLKNFKLNMAAGADLTKSVGPSAEFLQMPIAFNYR